MAQSRTFFEWTHEVHQYIPKSPTPEAHTLETWTPSPLLSSTTNKFWVIYIHGGAWWRPMIDASSFSLTVTSLQQSTLSPHISGFASLNYRLSTPPPLPQFAEFTKPNDPARNVKHPAHLNDVSAALAYLQATYGFGGNYVLVGHSCGATLAFQLQVRDSREDRENGKALEGPKGIVGVEGIYDLKKLVDDHAAVPMYRYFTESAFGRDEHGWASASPTTQKGILVWEGAEVVALTQSKEDELVDEGQVDVMWNRIVNVAASGTPERVSQNINLRGNHDEVWRGVMEGEKETQLAVAVEKVLELLVQR